MAKHTPAPWAVDWDMNHAVCVYTIDGHRPGALEASANAKLIAAAPEMLAELREMLEWALTEKAPLRAQEIASIRAVIAKATGKA